jgi:hypothetical protein
LWERHQENSTARFVDCRRAGFVGLCPESEVGMTWHVLPIESVEQSFQLILCFFGVLSAMLSYLFTLRF